MTMAKPSLFKINLQQFTEKPPTEPTEPVEPTEPTEPTEPQEVTEPPTEEYDIITYNKEEVKIPVSDRQTYLQKGYNYDKVHGQLEELKSSPALAFVERQAKANGMTVDEYLQAVEAQEQEAERQKMIAEGIPEQFIDTIKWAEAEKKRQADASKQKEIELRQQQEYGDFLEAYPDIDPKTIPEEVWQKADRGTPLKYAYMEHERDNLKANTEQEILKKLKDNESTSPGSANGKMEHQTSKWAGMSDEEFAKQIELAKQGMLTE